MMRLGLCCVFREAPIKFRTTTYAVCARMPRQQALLKIADIGRHNADSLRKAIDYCAAGKIGAFWINSQILPLKTHPVGGYLMRDLPDGKAIVNAFIGCGALARKRDIRLLFHPDQFILSIDEATVAALDTWDREPVFHVSSPLNGWRG